MKITTIGIDLAKTNLSVHGVDGHGKVVLRKTLSRMYYWKQWRAVRVRVRNLFRLGTGKKAAILAAISRRSYWHLSRSLATQVGMTNEWLKAQGLVSIRALWMKAQGYA